MVNLAIIALREEKAMIKNFKGMNITSKNPKRLVEFYRDILGIPVIEDDPNYDGVFLGYIKDAPLIRIWDENKWGKHTDGAVCLVFECDDHQKTYTEITQKGYEIPPPFITPWGGEKMELKDPDGNNVYIL